MPKKKRKNKPESLEVPLPVPAPETETEPEPEPKSVVDEPLPPRNVIRDDDDLLVEAVSETEYRVVAKKQKTVFSIAKTAYELALKETEGDIRSLLGWLHSCCRCENKL